MSKVQVMTNDVGYYVLKAHAVPEVLIGVVHAKKLLSMDKNMTVSEATDIAGISRSSFYKYKDDIFLLSDMEHGRTLTLYIEMVDALGLLSVILHVFAKYKANILTIHQSIPVSGIAVLSVSIEVLKETGDISQMIEELKELDNITDVKITGGEQR